MRIFATVLATLVALIVIGLVILYGGLYDVSASSGHSALSRWLFHTTMERSVETQAADIRAPDLDRSRVEAGVGHYVAMCEGCHGAPGIERGEVGRGLMPEPPDLAKAARRWNAAQLFWIVKHGIKMTGMPAWGKTDDDEELWSVVAFVQTLPETSAAQYQEMKARFGAEHEHAHDGATEGGHHSEGAEAGPAQHPHDEMGHAHETERSAADHAH